jgi:hypothetical protein
LLSGLFYCLLKSEDARDPAELQGKPGSKRKSAKNIASTEVNHEHGRRSLEIFHQDNLLARECDEAEKCPSHGHLDFSVYLT